MMMRRRGPGLIGTAARTAVIAGTATAVSGRVAERQRNREYERYAQQEAQSTAYAPPPQAAAAEPDYVAELEQLAQLKARGIITEEDYNAKKQQLLGLR